MLLLIATAPPLVSACAFAGTFTYEFPADTSFSLDALSMRIDLDAEDEPHIVWVPQRGSDPIDYAIKSHGTWTVESIEGSAIGARYDDLSLDVAPDNRSHVCYSSRSRLVYAQRSAGAWTLETVYEISPGEDRPAYPDHSIAAGQDGYPQIAWSDPRNHGFQYYQALFYFRRTPSSWVRETVHSDAPHASAGYGCSLVLDNQDAPHIAYAEVPGGAFESPSVRDPEPLPEDRWKDWLFYARKSGSTWTREIVASAKVGAIALALSSQMEPQIAYQRPDGKLFYAKRSAGVWAIETVDSTGLGQLSLSLDSFDNPHVIFSDGPKYARKSSGVWLMESIDIGSRGSLKVDAQGEAHVAYRFPTFFGGGGMLKYATNAVVGVSDGLLPSTLEQPLLTIQPNTIGAAGARVRWSVLNPGAALNVIVYDLTGRRVATLFEGIAPGGVREISWAGGDDKGRLLPSGVYVVSCRTGGAQAQARVAIVR